MNIRPASPAAYALLHEGALAMASLEAAGMRVDVPRLEQAIAEIDRSVLDTQDKMKQDELYLRWRRMHGNATKLGSRQQLAKLLFSKPTHGGLGLKSRGRTRTYQHAMTKDVLDTYRRQVPMVDLFLKAEKLKKTAGTFLKGIRREVVDGFLHCGFNLNTARTYRSSSDTPNFQNLPVRDSWMAKVVRQCFIPRPGHQFADLDFKAIEVGVGCAYHKDPVMMEYQRDSTKDMHKDMAARCFMLKPSQVAKNPRYVAKNMFVFPQFYGSFYVDCARNLWKAVKRMDGMQILRPGDVGKAPTGPSLLDHLASKGITRRGKCDPDLDPEDGTFEAHIRKEERRFWYDQFPDYTAWKKRWWQEYLGRGWFPLLTGFVCSGIHKRNEVINYAVQGAAFHCLLWSLIRLLKWLRKNKLRTVAVGQIHDSLVLDAHPAELQDVLSETRRIMTEDLPREWKWINVPLNVEVEVAAVGASWYQKEPWNDWDANRQHTGRFGLCPLLKNPEKCSVGGTCNNKGGAKCNQENCPNMGPN